MNVDNGNIYGPDEEFPDGVSLIPLDEDEYEKLRKQREKDVQKALRRRHEQLAKQRMK